MKGCSIHYILLLSAFVGAAAKQRDIVVERRRHLRGTKSSESTSRSSSSSDYALSTSSAERRSDSDSGNNSAAEESSLPAIVVEPLIDTDETVLGQRFEYPAGRAAITAVKITIPPGAATGPHEHSIPLFGYVTKGTLTVDYGSKGEITYTKGDSLVEAVDWPHEGRNKGKKDCELIAVYAGARGLPLSEPTKTLK